jgi:hypothetical protein
MGPSWYNILYCSALRWANNIKMDLGEREREDGLVWPALVWLRIGTSGELL